MYLVKGERYNRWTVLESLDRSEIRIDGERIAMRVRCQCECGNIKEVIATSLKSGASKSCGCLLYETSKSPYRKLRQMPESEFLTRIEGRNVELVPGQAWTSANARYSFRCRTCSHEWTVRASQISKGSDCPKCHLNAHNKRLAEIAKQRSLMSFLSKLPETVEFMPDQKWDGMKVKYNFHCLICDTENCVVAESVINGSPCAVCGRKRGALNTSHTRNNYSYSQMIAEVASRNIVFCPGQEWAGVNNRYFYRCGVCNHTWETLAESLMRGSGCPRCSTKRAAKILTIRSYVNFEEFLEDKPYSLVEGQNWTGVNRAYMFECEECGEQWMAWPIVLQRGTGCPICKDYAKDVFYVMTSDNAVKFGVSSGTGERRLDDHRRAGYLKTLRYYTDLPLGVAEGIESQIKYSLRRSGRIPIKGREYFAIDALPEILQIVDAKIEQMKLDLTA